MIHGNSVKSTYSDFSEPFALCLWIRIGVAVLIACIVGFLLFHTFTVEDRASGGLSRMHASSLPRVALDRLRPEVEIERAAGRETRARPRPRDPRMIRRW